MQDMSWHMGSTRALLTAANIEPICTQLPVNTVKTSSPATTSYTTTLVCRLVRLDLGCVRLARDPSTALMEPLASLTALSDLRMSVYSNEDATLTLQLSQLCALSNLQASSSLLAAAAVSLHVWSMLHC
jgi:hypothetical protein